ncbi:phospholipid carrier-dependent glycosyltransferase [Bacillus sp. HMF5848]|uniref:lmo0954 family membrane protein n=1 Tax=Bacillus sp. HMF5848 TaxID=2495421 RepID=UPI000F7B45F2|nr:phospholipid carrier-dependent glycosyltransferase [Bacillus sp. HMF5848]RSK26002.1 phospholipid carrier-dependent glycosyltransferase [Bacillus sp. HMF5848]
MKKFGLLLLAVIAGFALLASVGPLVGFIICLVIMYYAFKGFMKTDSTVKKVLWAIVGLIALSAAASNFPAIVAIVAAIVLYMVYKNWNKQKEVMTPTSTVSKQESDPFTNFEKQWAELHKN